MSKVALFFMLKAAGSLFVVMVVLLCLRLTIDNILVSNPSFYSRANISVDCIVSSRLGQWLLYILDLEDYSSEFIFVCVLLQWV